MRVRVRVRVRVSFLTERIARMPDDCMMYAWPDCCAAATALLIISEHACSG